MSLAQVHPTRIDQNVRGDAWMVVHVRVCVCIVHDRVPPMSEGGGSPGRAKLPPSQNILVPTPSMIHVNFTYESKMHDSAVSGNTLAVFLPVGGTNKVKNNVSSCKDVQLTQR